LSICTIMCRAQTIEQSFKTPPKSARPYTWWHWVNGNISKEGITKDLESMKALGIGGYQQFDAGLGIPNGKFLYNSPQYHEMIQFSLSEAKRLGLDAGFNNASGWSSSGGPWITPALSMKTVVWSEIEVTDGQNELPILAIPNLNLSKGKPNHSSENNTFYKDITVLAFPTPANDALRLPNWEEKTLRRDDAKPNKFIAADIISKDAIISSDKIINLSDKMDSSGKLNWVVPKGKWTIVRIGYTTTAATNKPASQGAIGLEVDKLSRKAVEVHWNSIVEKLIADADGKPSLSNILIDSYEVGSQNWTDDFAQQFKQLRGYDIIPKLVCMTGRVVDNVETTERVLWDMRSTVAELMSRNYFGYFAEKCHEKGLKLAIEPYGSGTFDAASTTLIADIPMTEFWQAPVRNLWQWTSQIVSSGAHLGGKSIVGAESFTSMNGDWQDSPKTLKAYGDLAFIGGVNRYYFHTMVHQPFNSEVLPGMTFSRYGGNFNRNNTWFNKSKAWMDYIARCQFILQQGIYKADILTLYGDERGFNNFLGASEPVDMKPIAGLSFDLGGIGSLKDLSVDKNGDIRIKAKGELLENRYKVLLLKRADLMLPENVEILGALADQGAKIYAPRPLRSPSLTNYLKADAKIQSLIKRYWDTGLIHEPESFESAVKNLPADCTAPDSVLFNHRKTTEGDFYFISNQKQLNTQATLIFNITGKQPEIWNPITGEISNAKNWKLLSTGFTEVKLPLTSGASYFIVFRKTTESKGNTSAPLITKSLLKLDGKWTVNFDPKWGPKTPVLLDSLISLSQSNNEEVKFFSGTANYSKTFTILDNQLIRNQSVYLNLGNVQVLAKVILNGKELGTLWMSPFKIDISSALKVGVNVLNVEVTNQWVNRLIGDDRLPPYTTNPKVFPSWLAAGEAPPSDTPLRTFSVFKHWKANDKLVPSGLIGPVVIEVETEKLITN
ncbi:glycosyl hydrolase, partial [Pelobium sp.]